MPPDAHETLPRWKGSHVVIRPVGPVWQVGIEPVPDTGAGQPRTYSSKHEAFGAARDLWTEYRLPCRDMTVGETARAHREK